MIYCAGIKIRSGRIALADGRITRGTQLSSARKVTMMEVGRGSNRFFIMNSGLRSVRSPIWSDACPMAPGFQSLVPAVEPA